MGWSRRLGIAGIAGLFGAATLAVLAPSAEERAEALRTEQLASDPRDDADHRELRALNPEWDLMRRVFQGMALADDALEHPERRAEDLARIDVVLRGLVDDEARHGQRWFLLGYADAAPWVGDGHSLFVDGEIALLAGARRVVADDPWVRDLHRQRVARIESAFARGPLPESYPDEAWAFCVTNALVALRMSDALDDTDHDSDLRRFADYARASLVEPRSGLVGSSFRTDGQMLDGPEGSTIWLVAANLRLIDPALADEQYARAREDLVHSTLGLAWASEWGPDWRGVVDVDSGPILPLIDASPSSSGFALLAARAFDDGPTLRKLERSLVAADVVVALDPRMAELADNAMGDVIVWHGLTFGPVWDAVGPPT